ncbi:hypothetical protein BN946_scf184985.g67 [Trametes cinnabarina]|uniref:YCII-related domain-containing protein n=1 Tax=Pycnoporus cinnabarinus TaxID=5643 RepID=A0A060SJM7_PYCCI|nr:hypothetical protein BN946_scf184985.g67 [Trametes cinnabarina]
MSDWTPPSYEHDYFVVHTFDVPNAQRTKHTDAHLVRIVPLIQQGIVKFAGALLTPTSKTTDSDTLAKTAGSILIVRAKDLEQAWEIVKQDPFYASGEVWDHERTVVTPAFFAIPEVKFD